MQDRPRLTRFCTKGQYHSACQLVDSVVVSDGKPFTTAAAAGRPSRETAGLGLMSVPRKLVAVVDDDPGMLKGVQRLLLAHGFDVEVFASAEAFLGRNTGSNPICLVVDIHLGGMSGIELRRRLAASGSAVPVIFMTAFDDEVVQNEATGAGCLAYLQKPFPAHLLMRAIDRAAG